MLEDVKIIAARDSAMRAVENMPDKELKGRAFEVILGRLLDAEVGPSRDTSAGGNQAPKAAKSVRGAAIPALRNKAPKSCSERILSLRDDGFFKSPRTLGEIRSELQMHGWTYPLTSLSGPVQKLVQKRELRRLAGGDEKKGSYTYVAP
jgi:hypothetical protein